VGKLHFGLAADEPREHVFPECEIGAGCNRPDTHHHQRSDCDPERDRPNPDLMASMRKRVALMAALDMTGHRCGGCARMGEACALLGNRMVRCNRMRHQNSAQLSEPLADEADINRIWLRNR